MSLSIRVFAILENDEIIKLPNSRFKKLHDFDEDTLYPEFKNKKIKIATFLIELENRKPISIIRDFYNYYEFDDQGKLNKEKYYEQMRVQLNTIDFVEEDKIVGTNIIEASKIFYQKRMETQYQWYPSDILKSKLHKLIFG